jgi:hypothetical protein
MISVFIALLLPIAAETPSKSRDAYARCLKDFVKASAEKKMDAPTFTAALSGACKDKEILFKNVMVSSEVALGIKRPVAEKGISEEINDYRSMAKEDFEAELASVQKPE